MTPQRVILEKTKSHIQLRVIAPDTLKGYTVIESTPINTGKSLPSFRKHGASYAKRFSIPFEDTTV